MNVVSGKGKALLLIHPPLAKAGEPPGGLARLAGALAAGKGGLCRLWDANLEGQLALLAVVGSTSIRDNWTRRAVSHREAHLAGLRAWDLYGHPDRYRRAVTDLNHLLALAGGPWGVRLSLADYEDSRLTPLRSQDLCHAAAAPETNLFYPWFSRQLAEIFEEGPFSHAGFSLNFLSQALTTFAMIGLLKRMAPHLSIVLGGGLATSWSRSPGVPKAFASLVDHWIAGPGEGPLLKLLGAEPPGINAAPALQGLPLTNYLAPGPILPYSAASGCWWRRCSFCPEQAEGNPYRPIPPSQVTEELRQLAQQWRPALIHLLDNALSPACLTALVRDPPGAPWYGFARFTPDLVDPIFCRRLRESGCVMLKLGLESGDQGVLDHLHKGFALERAAKALANLKEAGIATYIYLLFGTPAETLAEARRTLAFTAAQAGCIDFLNLAIFNLPAYGEAAQRLATDDFYSGDLSLYRSFDHPQGWQRRDVRRFLATEFKKEPAIAAILRRDPPYFTSNHAPLLVMGRRLR